MSEVPLGSDREQVRSADRAPARDVVDAMPVAVRDSLILRVDEAFDTAARTGFAVCVGVLVLAAIAAAVALAPERGAGSWRRSHRPYVLT